MFISYLVSLIRNWTLILGVYYTLTTSNKRKSWIFCGTFIFTFRNPPILIWKTLDNDENKCSEWLLFFPVYLVLAFQALGIPPIHGMTEAIKWNEGLVGPIFKPTNKFLWLERVAFTSSPSPSSIPADWVCMTFVLSFVEIGPYLLFQLCLAHRIINQWRPSHMTHIAFL